MMNDRRSVSRSVPVRSGVLLSRRSLLRGIGASAAALALGACGSNGEAGGSGPSASRAPADDGGDDEFTISGTFWGEASQAEAVVQVAELYAERQQQITLETEYSGFAGYYDKLATRVAGGSPPDFFQLHIVTLSDYGSRGVTRSLEDLWDQPLGLSEVAPAIAESCRLDGTYYFVPLGVSTQPAVVYDATVIEELGLTPPAEDWTLDDFTEFAGAISEEGGPDFYGTSDFAFAPPALDAFIRGRGKNLFDDSGSLAATEEDMGDWFALWDDLRSSGACVPQDVTVEAGAGFADNPMVHGTAAITMAAASKGVAGLQSLTDHELRFVAFPKASPEGPQGTVLGPVEWWALSTELPDDKAKAIADFISFRLTDPDALDIIGLTNGVPVLDDVREELSAETVGLDKLVYDNIAAVAEQDPAPRSPYPPGAGELFHSVLLDVSQSVGFGDLSVQEGASQFVAEADRVLGG